MNRLKLTESGEEKAASFDETEKNFNTECE